MISKTPLKIVDRLAGLALGLLVSAILIFLPLVLIESLPAIQRLPAVRQTMQRSVLLPFFQPTVMGLKNQVGHVIVGYWKKWAPDIQPPANKLPLPPVLPKK